MRIPTAGVRGKEVAANPAEVEAATGDQKT
jgi:hypothetical protein